MSRLTGRRARLLLCCGVLTLSGCVSPALGTSSYQGKAQSAAAAALSEVQTARLIADQILRGRIPRAYADETVSASEMALGSIGDSFGSVEPPRGADGLRDELTAALDAADDAVAATRIATRRSDRARLHALLGTLDEVAKRLSGIEEKTS